MRSKGIAWVCFAVISALLLGLTVGVLAVKGDWRYRLFHSVRVNRAPQMEQVTPTEAWRGRTVEELLCEGAVLSDELILVSRECSVPDGWEPTLSN